MSTVDEVLATAEVVDAVCVIDGETRIISVPSEYKELGVESDENVTRIKFQCPKIVGDNIDLTEYNLYINYRNAGNKLNSYLIKDATVTGDVINFSWLLSRHVTESPGTISYIVCAKKSDYTGVINEWNTKVATGTVGVGLEATEEIEEQNIDIIEQILRSIVELENGTGGTAGLTTAQINALDGMFKVCAFIKADISEEYNAFRTAFNIKAAAITGISATYSGGSVPAGTALDDLTGIVVTAQYSDGSTATVTGYTLSGEIAEGSNTITVTYQDKTATFTVTGTAAAQVYTVTNNLTNVTNSNAQTEVTDGFYSATLTVADGYSMQSVVITMGGVDVTDSVYGDGNILITAVTGDIVITAVAGVALAYALPEPLTFAGTGNAAYDTGYAMYPDGDKDVSICVDFSVESGPGSNVNIIYSGVTYGYRLWRNGAGIFRVNACQADAVTDIGTPCENARLVWTKEKGRGQHYAYAFKNDAVTKYTGNGYGYFPTASTVTTQIGTTETAFKGTIHDFRVYDQVLSAGQIEAYLRGGTI